MHNQLHTEHANSANLYKIIMGELAITWRFTYNNLSAATFPGIIFTLIAFHASGRPSSHMPQILLQSIIYFWLYIYTFDVLNQIMGVEEDRLNKPWRPIISGLVTKEGAWVRFTIPTLLYNTVGWALGVIGWTLAWQAMAIFLNLGASRHWFWKNLMMPTGGIAQLAAAWQMVTPLTQPVMVYIVLVTMPIGLIVSLQDLRDIEGDLQMKRRTFPIVFGDVFTRWEVAISQLAYPIGALAVLWYVFGLHTAVVANVFVTTIVSGIVAVRILCFRTPEDDKRTYMCFTYWYCFTVAAGAFILT